ncbi:hypothetical protein TWF694_001315 [Orbilia ellipsospora]|uniref:Nucleoside phosphorylase domain-containing protein n=1 Tax=Orbilia ellipsospora TaxID=2528407 RepID=A0AAV9XT41_9PEZI
MMLEAIGSFSQVMREVYNPMRDIYNDSVAVETKSKGGKANTQLNFQFGNAMQSLHHSLTSNSTKCSRLHAARLHLPIFEISDPELPNIDLNIYLSTCAESMSWQCAQCVVQIENSQPHPPKRLRYQPVHNLCQTIHRSQGYGLSLRLMFEGQNLWDLSNPRERKPIVTTCPSVSLRSLLDDGYFRQSDRERLSKVSLKEKRTLAVVLAHTMLQLCGGPWIHETWDAANIYFLYDSANQRILNLRKPYINAPLRSPDHVISDTDDRIHRYPLILDFARLLLEIQHGETMQPTEADCHAVTQEMTPDTPFFMVNRVLNEVSDDIFQDYQAAIEACLEFDKYLPSEDTTYRDSEFRNLIYTHVVEPLEEELYKGFKLKFGELGKVGKSEGSFSLQQFTSISLSNTASRDVGTVQVTSTKEQTTRQSASNCTYTEVLSSTANLQVLNDQINYSQTTIEAISTESYTPEAYNIGIVCPMGVELVPILAILDREHPSLPSVGRRNKYTLGQIGHHNVVITVMPEIGNNAAAAVVTQLQNDFRSLRFTLLVGIGGGVPDLEKHDIRLGDVVVSKPNMEFGGVVQFDRGKANIDSFERTGLLNKPPAVLMASLEELIARHKLKGNKMGENLSEMLRRYPNLIKEQYVDQGEENDTLFHHDYSHSHGSDCNGCQKDMIVRRIPRMSRSPKIHYGTIGSSNLVVKDAGKREKLRQELGIICVDMEAAGLVNEFPCLVIRGICDYADSHKAKRWQPYAAATAAAFTKELLSVVPA